MNHPKEELLALSAGGDLPMWSAWQVRRHLRSCAACRETLEAYANLRVGLSALPAPEPPVNLAASILAGIPRFSDPAPRFSLFGRLAFGGLAATAALAAAGVLAVLVMPHQQTSLPSLVRARVAPPTPSSPYPAIETPVTTPEEAPAKSVATLVARFTTVKDAEEDRDRRYLAGFASALANSNAPRTNPVLDQWMEGLRAQDRHLPRPVVGLRAEMFRSHALPARVEVVALPGSPLEIVSAEALFAEGHLIDPVVEVRNASSRVIRDYQIVWVFRDATGAEFRGTLMAARLGAKGLGPGARAKLSETIVLEAQKNTRESALATARVFVRSATVAGSAARNEAVWVPDRTMLEARHLGEFLPLPAQTARLLDDYRRSGVQALAQLR